MREISCAEVTQAVRQLCIEANTQLPGDLRQALERAAETEESPVGRGILGDIAENFRFAGDRGLPICQDTGMAVIFAELGQEVHITDGAFEDAVNEDDDGLLFATSLYLYRQFVIMKYLSFCKCSFCLFKGQLIH